VDARTSEGEIDARRQPADALPGSHLDKLPRSQTPESGLSLAVSEDEMADATTERHPPARTGISKLVLTMLVLNLAATATVVAKAYGVPSELAFSRGVDAEGDEASADAPGPVQSMDPFLVNLNEPEGGRFLRVTLDIEVRDESSLHRLVEGQRIVRDEILRYLSNLTVADTMGEKNRLQIQGGIAERVSAKLGDKTMVRNVYFADFVVQ
jgi:flagellar FliL protein